MSLPRNNIVLLVIILYTVLGITLIFHQNEAENAKRQRECAAFMQQIKSNIFLFRENHNKINKRKYRKKRWWRKNRSNEWWERIVKIHFTEDDFIDNFRLSKKSFNFVCYRLNKYLCAAENYVREPLTVEKKCAIALYKLSSCAEYRVIANQFGTHKSVVHKCLYAFCEAVIAEFKDECLKFPNEFEGEEIRDGFEKICGIPNVIGAIDGTHIPILPPKQGYRDFLNRKGWPSYNMLAIVDNLYRFRYATCKHPGSTHDAKVLRDSNLFQFSHRFIPKLESVINNIKVPCFILGDPAYPLLPWLIRPYKGAITREEESFNVYLSRGRVVVENAFGRLKARFRCLLKRTDINYHFIPKVVFTCLILHNIIETNKDTFVQGWLDKVKEAEIIFPQPKKTLTREYDNIEAGHIRDTLKTFMLKFPMRRSCLV